MLKTKREAQSTLEYSLLIIVVLAAILAIGNYFKRGVQGRWKATIDGMGDQYDPRFADSSITSILSSNTTTNVYIIPSGDGFFTKRRDTAKSIETKTGSTIIASELNATIP